MTRTKTLIAAAVGGLAALLRGSLAATLIFGSGRGHDGGGHHDTVGGLAYPGGGLVDEVDVLAQALGISAEEVEQAKEDGTLKDLLADMNRVALVAAFVDARDAAIDAAVEAGDITAEQAELLRDTAKGFGGRMGRGHHGRWDKGCDKSGDWSGDKKDSTSVGDPA